MKWFTKKNAFSLIENGLLLGVLLYTQKQKLEQCLLEWKMRQLYLEIEKIEQQELTQPLGNQSKK